VGFGRSVVVRHSSSLMTPYGGRGLPPSARVGSLGSAGSIRHQRPPNRGQRGSELPLTCNGGRSVHPSSRPHNGMTSPARLGHGMGDHDSDMHPMAQWPTGRDLLSDWRSGWRSHSLHTSPGSAGSALPAWGACPARPDLPRHESWAALWPRSVAGRPSRVHEAWRRTRNDFSIAMVLPSRIGNRN
jgi:hypothetical protein